MPRTAAPPEKQRKQIGVSPEIHEGLRRYYRLHRAELESRGIRGLGPLADELLYDKLRHVLPKYRGP